MSQHAPRKLPLSPGSLQSRSICDATSDEIRPWASLSAHADPSPSLSTSFMASNFRFLPTFSTLSPSLSLTIFRPPILSRPAPSSLSISRSLLHVRSLSHRDSKPLTRASNTTPAEKEHLAARR
eukprot:1991032-Pleurochrysis_carterae.AAC.3